MAINKKNPNTERKTTPKKVDYADDARKDQNAGKYPYYWSQKSRSGHNIVMDDTSGQETVTIQHRTGSAIQMMQDGSVYITTHNGRYEVTFGEHRMTISGAHDITVKGDASLRVYGDYNATVHGNYNMTVMGDFNVTAKNKNQHIRGNMDTQAKNETKKIEGSGGHMYGGGLAMTAKQAVSVVSTEDQAHFGGASGLHMAVTKEGPLTVKNEKGDTHLENKDGKFDMKLMQGEQLVSFLAEQGVINMIAQKAANIVSQEDKIKIKAQQTVGVESQQGGVEVKAPSGDIQVNGGQNVQVKAGQTASLKGGTSTAVEAPQVSVVGQASGVHIDGSVLNLNSGSSSPFSGQFSFSFGDITQAAGLPSYSRNAIARTEDEPDASTWTKQLA